LLPLRPMACLILNPGARSGDEAQAELVDLLAPLGGVRVRVSERRGHAEALAREEAAGGETIFFAAGGDGTLHEVVNGLSGAFGRVRLGVLPLGTGNDFARSLGMPEAPEAAVAALAAGRTRRCDLVRFQGGGLDRYVANVASAGFGGELDGLTPELKASWGPLAYLRAAIQSLPERSGHLLRLRFDGVAVESERAYNLVVANGRYVAGGIPVAPYAEIDDGVFDVVVIKECGLPGIAALTPKALAGRHLEGSEDKVLFRQARTLEVIGEPPMALNLDGEQVGEHNGHFDLVPAALEVFVGSG
jgi:diacylglycerol kinase (ATP)